MCNNDYSDEETMNRYTRTIIFNKCIFRKKETKMCVCVGEQEGIGVFFSGRGLGGGREKFFFVKREAAKHRLLDGTSRHSIVIIEDASKEKSSSNGASWTELLRPKHLL